MRLASRPLPLYPITRYRAVVPAGVNHEPCRARDALASPPLDTVADIICGRDGGCSTRAELKELTQFGEEASLVLDLAPAHPASYHVPEVRPAFRSDSELIDGACISHRQNIVQRPAVALALQPFAAARARLYFFRSFLMGFDTATNGIMFSASCGKPLICD